MWHAVIAHATHLRDAFPRAEIAGSRRGTLILACAMHSTVEVRQQLQPRRPPYPPLRRQLQPRQPPYPPPIHLLVARDHSLGVQKRKQTDDSQGTPRTIGRGQRRDVAVHVQTLLKPCMQAARSACQSAGPTKKKRSCGHQRETCWEGLRVAPASVDRASTVGSHSAHARQWRDDGIQQPQATEKYSCASAAEKAAHLNSWTLPHDDRVDSAAE